MTFTRLSILAAVIAAMGVPLSAQGRGGRGGGDIQVAAGQQLYRANCIPCHGENGDSVAGIDFRRGLFKRASTDDDISNIIANGIPGTGMPPTNLPEPRRRELVAYLRSMHNTYMSAAGTGDKAHGEALFESKGCLGCHRVGTKGSHVGPDLSDVGALRKADYIERSILDPNADIMPQYRSVHLVMRDGTVINGRRLDEDTYTLQLIDQRQRLVSVSKSDVKEYTLVKNSPMPSYKGKFSSQEMTDLVAYLLSLKGLVIAQ